MASTRIKLLKQNLAAQQARLTTAADKDALRRQIEATRLALKKEEAA